MVEHLESFNDSGIHGFGVAAHCEVEVSFAAGMMIDVVSSEINHEICVRVQSHGAPPALH